MAYSFDLLILCVFYLPRTVFLLCCRGVMSWGEPEFIHVLWGVLVVVGILRMARPFIVEIVLLEKNPVFAKDKKAITIGRRSRRLHGPSSGELFGRSLIVGLVLWTAVISVSFSFLFIQGLMTNLWVWGPMMVRVFVPLSLWIVAIYTTVYRFLSYLDLRIRREGWEVELKVRAAAAELQGVRV